MIFENIIKVPLFPVSIQLIVTDDAEKYCRDNVLKLIDIQERACVYDVNDFPEFPHAWILLMRNDSLQENVIVHETLHLIAQILRRFDTNLVDETEEVYAYLQEYLYKIIRQRTIEAKAKWQ